MPQMMVFAMVASMLTWDMYHTGIKETLIRLLNGWLENSRASTVEYGIQEIIAVEVD